MSDYFVTVNATAVWRLRRDKYHHGNVPKYLIRARRPQTLRARLWRMILGG